MKKLLFFIPFIFLGACSSSRTINDVAGAGLGGGAAFLGSKGDPLITAGGAAVGLAIAEMTHAGEKKNDIAQYNRGYSRGASDNAKLTYEVIQDIQKSQQSTAPKSKIVKYQVPAPTKQGSVNFDSNEKSIQVVEPEKSKK